MRRQRKRGILSGSSDGGVIIVEGLFNLLNYIFMVEARKHLLVVKRDVAHSKIERP